MIHTCSIGGGSPPSLNATLAIDSNGDSLSGSPKATNPLAF